MLVHRTASCARLSHNFTAPTPAPRGAVRLSTPWPVALPPLLATNLPD